MNNMIRVHQGDVFLVETVLPEGERTFVRNEIAAFGEITGHAHRVKGSEIVSIGGREFLVLKEETPMTHEEHPPVNIPALPSGKGYEIRIQQEYFPEGLRNVAD